MATFVLTDASLTLNSVDLSDWVSSVTLSIEMDEQEDTAMGDSFRSRLGGLRDYTLDVEFFQDFANSAVDQTVYPLILSQLTPTAFVLKATSSAVSATNPTYSGSVLVNQYDPVAGSVGDVASFSVSWPGSGTLTRATA